MTTTWKTVTNFAFSLPNRPGELARFTQQLRDAGISMLGLWGDVAHNDKPRLSCVPESPETFRAFVKSAGIETEEGRAFYLTDANRPGALTESLETIGEAGINIDAIEAVSADGQFGCFLWADEKHWDGLEQLLT